jgi:hypothetical protein
MQINKRCETSISTLKFNEYMEKSIAIEKMSVNEKFITVDLIHVKKINRIVPMHQNM